LESLILDEAYEWLSTVVGRDGQINAVLTTQVSDDVRSVDIRAPDCCCVKPSLIRLSRSYRRTSVLSLILNLVSHQQYMSTSELRRDLAPSTSISMVTGLNGA
jgi:hypothetical protein